MPRHIGKGSGVSEGEFTSLHCCFLSALPRESLRLLGISTQPAGVFLPYRGSGTQGLRAEALSLHKGGRKGDCARRAEEDRGDKGGKRAKKEREARQVQKEWSQMS